MTKEQERLEEDRERQRHWKRWGPYLSDRAWGTVREDYSPNGTAWEYFPHDHARSRAFRWNDDGLLGIADRHQRICFALALWNGQDPILKERFFGLTGNEGNHGEDVKEYYFFLDSTPTHSYMKGLYRYPQAEFPYARLVEENRRRGRDAPEYELVDTGVFAGNRYFDVTVEYAKADCDDILIRVSVANRGPEAASIEVLPSIWFRNTWSWSDDVERPSLHVAGDTTIALREPRYGARWLYCDGLPQMLVCENETNTQRLFGVEGSLYPKDAINDAVVNQRAGAVNPERVGTKAAARYRLSVPAGEEMSLRLRLTDLAPDAFESGAFDGFDAIVNDRLRESDEFYATVIPPTLTRDEQQVMRHALAGVLWSKQYYHYVVRDWLRGDPKQPAPPPGRELGRNHQWRHLFNADVISMPDKWEYPWYAAWDLAFHCVPLALVDSQFAKDQLVLMLREWYMHPNGQLPAYEWAFGDVNPPVHAWAAWRVYKIEKKRRGIGDRVFLEKVFQKLLLNFTWCVNRKDAEGNNVFQGGFLGLDNIGVFDRSAALPTGGRLDQSDSTSWMGMYCLNLLAIAMELARENPAYEDMASKFWEHFVYIAHAMGNRGVDGFDMWDEEDGFFYDVLHRPDGSHLRLKVRSLVGLMPLLAVETIEPELLDRLPDFKRRLEWFIDHRPDLTKHVACMRSPGRGDRRLLSIANGDRLRRILQAMLDESEFLGPHGIRAVSRRHLEHPYVLAANGVEHRVSYEPGESTTGLFGGNSNWRGPVWFPVNFLLIESLQKFHHYFGDDLTVECPRGSGRMMNLWEAATEISRRLTSIFLVDTTGTRPVFGSNALFQHDPLWRDLVPFHEYFHGDTGAGLGASHQTGWTALVAKLLQQQAAADEFTVVESRPHAAAEPTGGDRGRSRARPAVTSR